MERDDCDDQNNNAGFIWVIWDLGPPQRIKSLFHCTFSRIPQTLSVDISQNCIDRCVPKCWKLTQRHPQNVNNYSQEGC